MGFIVLEGLDGAGKSTQIRFIEEFLGAHGIKTKFIHFPRTDAPFWGELVSRFLRGDLGAIDTVNPYLVALIYAGDRKDAAQMLLEWMEQGYMVIADRYLYSNIAFQCAKVENPEDRAKLAKWIKEYEYGYNGIPVPDLNIFLDVPFQFTEKSLSGRRLGKDRDYLEGATDIHEASLDFQQEVRKIYLWQIEENVDFQKIDCSDPRGAMLRPEAIASQLSEKIKKIIKIQ
ncbi:MAG: thymidylate kinase [Bacteroidales bacterium]|nr:thymidylate kinase [Bacteroidales bacterium]